MSDNRTARVQEEVFAALPPGYLLEDCSVVSAGRRRLVQIGVEREVPEAEPLGAAAPATTQAGVEPVTLDDVAEVTRAVSEALDASDVMGEQPYVLEVSSYGVDRPLTEYRHYRRNVGRLVTLTTRGGAAAQHGGSVAGRLLAVGSDVLVLDVGGSPEPLVIPLDDAAGARVEVEFSRAGTDEEDD